MYNLADFKRNPTAVVKTLNEEDDGSVYCTKACSYFMPKKLHGSPLLRPDINPARVGAFGMLLVGRDYMVFNACAVMSLGESESVTVLVDGVECTEFKFEPGDLVIENLNVPVIQTLGYPITKEFGKKAVKLPWYTHDDQLSILLTLKEFTGVSTPSFAYTNIYMSHFMRDPSSLETPYRLVKDKRKTPFEPIPISLVGVTVNNTLNALGGSYMDDAVQGRLINESVRTTPLEEVLTS